MALDLSESFRPAVCYMISEEKSISIALTSSIFVFLLPRPWSGLSDPQAATATASAAGFGPPSFLVSRASPFSRLFECTTQTGDCVAKISGPMLGFGRWKIELQSDDCEAKHPHIELRLTGQTELFVLDSVPYSWTRRLDGNLWLSMEISGQRRKIAEFRGQRHPRRNMDGYLQLDDQCCSAEITLMTLLGVLKRSGSLCI